MQQLLKSANSVALALDMSREGLRKLINRDPTFPRPIKLGESRQAAVFFDAQQIEQWLELKKASHIQQAYGAITVHAANDE